MAKPMEQFGGWLRFFQVVALLNLVIVCVAVGLMVYLYSTSPAPKAMTLLQLLVLVVFSIPYGLAMIRILRLIPRKGRRIPCELARTTWAAVGILLLAAVAEACAIMQENPSLDFLEAVTWPRPVLWLVLFASYLQASKRVNAFYGANARTVFQARSSVNDVDKPRIEREE